MATTAFQRLKKSKASHCKGRGTKAAVRRAATAYIKSAVSKGKTKTEARRVANKELNRSCSTGIGKKKRKLRVKHVIYGKRRKRGVGRRKSSRKH